MNENRTCANADTPLTQPCSLPVPDHGAPDIHVRDDGKHQIGLDDESALGPFESRSHADAVGRSRSLWGRA
jgi:hypothetical protein